MDIATIILLVVASIGASVVQRVSGFGFGIFIMTMLPFIMPSYGEATALSGILAALQSLMVVVAMWRFVSAKRLLPILFAFLITSYIAIQYVETIDEHLLKRIFGVVLVALSIYFFCISDKVSVRPYISIQLILGSLSGIMGGLFAMQGPPAVLYFVASERDKEHYIAITQAYFLIGNLFMTLYRYKVGFVTELVGYGVIYALEGVVLGSFLGKYLFDRISTHLLRKVVYAFMALSGLYAICVG